MLQRRVSLQRNRGILVLRCKNALPLMCKLRKKILHRKSWGKKKRKKASVSRMSPTALLCPAQGSHPAQTRGRTGRTVATHPCRWHNTVWTPDPRDGLSGRSSSIWSPESCRAFP